jgi:hypothetical protein
VIAAGGYDWGQYTSEVYFPDAVRPTRLSAERFDTGRRLSARLTESGTGAPLADRLIRFESHGATVCAAFTSSTGWARCPTVPDALSLPANGKYDSVFDGGFDYRSSRTSAGGFPT